MPDPEDQIMMLLLKHEGEQRTWAYPIHWVKKDEPLPESMDQDIANRIVQLCQDTDAPVLKTRLVPGTRG